MANTSVFDRLRRLFSTDVVIRNVGGNQVKTIDSGHIQSSGEYETNALVDRFNRVYSTAPTSLYGAQFNLNYQYLRTQLYSEYDAILAVDGFTVLKTDAQNAFEDLKTYQSTTKDWLFGYLSYDLKNDTELLTSNNFDGLNFPDLYFFQPKKLWLLKDNILEAHYLAMVDDEIDEDGEYAQGLSYDDEDEDDSKNDDGEDSVEFDDDYDGENCYSIEDLD